MFRFSPKLSLDMLLIIILMKKITHNAHLAVYIHKSPLLGYIMIANVYSGWSAMFGAVAESVGVFFEVLSYQIYFQNICYEHRTLYMVSVTISMQELRSLPVIYVLLHKILKHFY